MTGVSRTRALRGLAAVIVFAIECGPRSPVYQNGKAVIEASQLQVAGVSIGSDEKSLQKAFGRPVGAWEGTDPIQCQPSKDIMYDGVRAYCVNGRVHNLRCSSKSLATRDGVKVGLSALDVMRIYGKTEAYEFQDYKSLCYPVPNTGKALVVHLKDEKVVSIELCYE